MGRSKLNARSDWLQKLRTKLFENLFYSSSFVYRRMIDLQIYLLLTENCNLNCAMCIRGKQHGRNMDINELKRITDNNDFSEHDIVITGGEPSIHENYSEIVRIMVNHSRTVTITSNGTLDLKLEQLKEIDNLYFQISLDGDMNLHNAIRGKRAFESAWENIKKMDALGIRYSIASVVSRKNKIGIFNLLPLLEKLEHLRFWKISYEMPFGSATGIEDIMTAQEWNTFVDELLVIAKLRVKIQKIFPFELYDKRKDELERMISVRKRSINCGSGLNKLYVYPMFEVYPCTCLIDFSIGNLRKQRLSDILNSEMIKMFSEYELASEAVCQECEYKKFCNGGCIGMSYHYLGKLGMGDLRCPKVKR